MLNREQCMNDILIIISFQISLQKVFSFFQKGDRVSLIIYT